MTEPFVDVVPFDTPYAYIGSATQEEGRAYCRKLACRHYENFVVGSLALPKHIRQHFYNVYAFCRVADDLADESPEPSRALALLDWWERELERSYVGGSGHPVLVAIAETNAAFGIPPNPYKSLLSAFRQDQRVRRYETYEEVLDYCTRSANPVGHLVLHLFGYTDAHRRHLADATCTALQLANFWQDVARDHEAGRVYIPAEDLARFGVTEDDIAARQCTPQFRDMLRFECDRTAELFAYGRALGAVVDRALRVDLEMISRGGEEILRRIRARRYDVLSQRPTVPRSRQLSMLFSLVVRRAIRLGH